MYVYISAPISGSKKDRIDKPCYVYETYGKCSRGLTCLFYKSHTDEDKNNIVNKDLWSKMEPMYLLMHNPILSTELKIRLRKRAVDFKHVDRICGSIDNMDSKQKTVGPSTDEDSVTIRSCEIKKVRFLFSKNKLFGFSFM